MRKVISIETQKTEIARERNNGLKIKEMAVKPLFDVCLILLTV